MPDSMSLSEVLLDYITRYGLTPKARDYLRRCAEEEWGQDYLQTPSLRQVKRG